MEIISRKDHIRKMKAFCIKALNEVAWMCKERPVCGPLDAICEPIAHAICTSDVHMVYGGIDGGRGDLAGLALGHEVLGCIVEVGSMVKDFKIGDKVVVPAITPDYLTYELQGGLPPQHFKGFSSGQQFSLKKDGTFAEYFHVNLADMNLAHLPDKMTLDAALMCTDMVSTGFWGAEMADIQLGSTLVVFGAGPVGLMAVAGGRLKGAGRIIIVDNNTQRMQLALEFGADEVVNFSECSPIEQIMNLTNKKGVDSAILAGGDENILGIGLSVVRPGGTVANLNYFTGVPTIPIPRREWNSGLSDKIIRGGLCPGGRMRMERLARMVMNGRFDPTALVTHRFTGFDSIETAFFLMKDKPQGLIKPVVYM